MSFSSFSFGRVQAVVWKDLLDLRKNRGMVWSMLALPTIIVIVPMFMVWAYLRNPDDSGLKIMAQYYDPTVKGSDAARFLVDKVLSDWFVLYLVMPVFVPMLVSSHAVAGEKEKRTLEPLLASPITSLELVVGKSLASLIPAIAICLLAFAALSAGVDLVTWRHLHEVVLPNQMWVFGVLVVAPLFAFFGNGVSVLISARVGDSRLAQQLAGLFVLPLVGLSASQFGGWLKSGTLYYAVIGLIVLVLDVGLLLAAQRLFDRERLMTRWG